MQKAKLKVGEEYVMYSLSHPTKVRLDEIGDPAITSQYLTVTSLETGSSWWSSPTRKVGVRDLVCPWNEREQFGREQSLKEEKRAHKQRDKQTQATQSGEMIQQELLQLGFKENSAFKCKRRIKGGVSHPQFLCDWTVMTELLSHHPQLRENPRGSGSALGELLGGEDERSE